jgi:glycosyltransferase involved in cell wall biosynthesis
MSPPVIAWKPFTDSPNRASARLRSFLPCRYLREAGWRCEIFERENLASYKLVIFQKAYDEDSITLAKLLADRGVKTILDLSDNHFYNPHDLPALGERAKRLHRMIEAVDAVSVSTPELGKLIDHRDCVVIDDVVDAPQSNAALLVLSRLKDRLTNILSARPLRIVWYGNAGSENPPFGLIDLPRALPHLEALHAQMPVELTIISNSEDLFRKYLGKVHFPVTYYEWTYDTFPSIFRRQDVCIIPVAANPFTFCKTSNRLVLSLLMGVPVIADEIPSYSEFRDFVFLSDWQNSLRAYAADKELRRQHVRRGRLYIQSKYNKKRVVSQWSALFERMLGSDRGRS